MDGHSIRICLLGQVEADVLIGVCSFPENHRLVDFYFRYSAVPGQQAPEMLFRNLDKLVPGAVYC